MRMTDITEEQRQAYLWATSMSGMDIRRIRLFVEQRENMFHENEFEALAYIRNHWAEMTKKEKAPQERKAGKK